MIISKKKKKSAYVTTDFKSSRNYLNSFLNCCDCYLHALSSLESSPQVYASLRKRKVKVTEVKQVIGI